MESDVIAISGLTYAAIEALKRSRMPDRYAGVASMFVGVAISFLYGLRDGHTLNQSGVATIILSGIISGLIASGFYSTTKAVAERY